MKRFKYILLLFMPLLWSCFEDKGNYDYHEVGEIVIEDIPDMIEVLSNADRIVITPKVISTVEGEIKDGDPNYEFIYRFDLKRGSINRPDPWVVLNPSGSMNLDTLATFPSNSYIGWFIVKDLRTDIETYKTFDVNITSPTFEGWMVLCNEGDDNRVRFDMISRISADRITPVHDIMTDLGLPECTNATQLGLLPSLYAQGDAIYIFSETGSYGINASTFETDESWNVKNNLFIIPPKADPVAFVSLNTGWMVDNMLRFCVTADGNAFAKTESSFGASFELPINTSVRGGNPEYRVAPYIGVSMARPGNGSSALMYDIDNKRFVGWAYVENADGRQIMTPLTDPENKLFSFNTGKDLVYMESTRFSGGLTYAILQATDGERSVCGINMGGEGFVQEAYYAKINASEFKQATKFAFHSQYPFMFYAVKNKVYLYDLGTGTNYPLEGIKLGANEEVTMLKFNLYQQPSLDNLDQSEEFLGKQYNLIVGSYDNGAAGVNGGKVGFYKIDRSSHSVTKLGEYDGFAKVKDVVYRERRKQ